MKLFKKLQSLLTLCFLAVGFAASAGAHEAKVLKVKGNAYVQLPGSTSTQAITADMLIPAGALITTQGDAEVFIEALPGVVTSVEANTTVAVEKLAITTSGGKVTSQEALLELRKGSVISTLDPAKKGINQYGVRTPKGVAAARGTVFAVSVDVTGTTVMTLSGSVSIDLGNGQSVDIPVGMAVTGDSSLVTTIAAAIAASGQEGLTVDELLQQVVQVVADNVAANTSAAGGSDTATALLAAVVNAAISASPGRAEQFTQTAIAAVSSGSSATGGSNASIAAVTEAAVRANPTAAAQISRAAAAAAVQTKVAEAVAAAVANNQDPVAAATAASNAATSTLQAIAQSTLAGAGATADSPLAQTIVTAINTGSQQGMSQATQTAQVEAPAPAIAVAAPATDTQGEAPSQPVVTPETPTELPPVSPSGSGF
jgi:Uncharacterized protein conserved in bacteria